MTQSLNTYFNVQICYSEFYSISADAKSKNPAEWYVDRFCVHKEQCLRRGIGAGRCVDLSKLDRVVQETFRVKINQKHTINTEKRLLHSEFCCCSESLCNKLNLEKLKSRFNLSLVNSTVRNEYGVVKTVLILFGVLKLVLIE